MKVSFLIAILLVIGLVSISCQNLKTDSQFPICSQSLQQKFNNPKATLSTTDLTNLFKHVKSPTSTALSVVTQAASMGRAASETFFYLAQVMYQTEADYLALDPELVNDCDPYFGLDYCFSTCFHAYLQAPKPQNADGTSDDTVPNLNGEDNKCLKALRPFERRIPKQKSQFIITQALFQTGIPNYKLEVCFDAMPSAFVQANCEMSFNQVYDNFLNENMQQLNQTNPIKQIQLTYQIARHKFGHNIAKISMGCRSYINTDPITDAEIGL